MENKQTAVEWLVDHWKKLQSEGEKMSWNQIIQITELAKAMEKEQIISSWISGNINKYPYSDLADKYYTSTYGQ